MEGSGKRVCRSSLEVKGKMHDDYSVIHDQLYPYTLYLNLAGQIPFPSLVCLIGTATNGIVSGLSLPFCCLSLASKTTIISFLTCYD